MINNNINKNKNISFYLNKIQEDHNEMTMEFLKIFCCRLEDFNLQDYLNTFSYGNCDSRYTIFSLQKSTSHSIEDKERKLKKLEILHKNFHTQMKKLLNYYNKNNEISEYIFNEFANTKKSFNSFLTELIIEAEGFEKRFDGLTNFFNKKYFFEEVSIRSSRVDYTIVMADIDHFKKINDTYGHHAGDFILSELASLYKEFLRKDDILGRYGGEEFIFFLHGNLNSSINVIERMRSIIEKKEFNYEGKKIRITSSFGLCENYASLPLQALIKKADKALYKSKENGRNLISVHEH